MSAPRVLDPRAARTLYNVADALGAEAFDLAPSVELHMVDRSRRERRRLRLLLRWIECEPRLTLRSTRSFSWLARSDRRATLARWEQSHLRLRRRGFALLETLVREARASRSDAQSPDGA